MSLLSQSLLLRYPPSIQSKLLQDRDSTKLIGLQTARVFTLGNSVSVTDEQLFSAVRSALRQNRGSSFKDRKGQKVRIHFCQDSIEIAVDNSEIPPIWIPEFLLFSSNPTRRVQTIKKIIDLCGPTAPDFTAQIKAAENRELTNAEVSDILTELHQGVAVHLARAAGAFVKGYATLEDLVPPNVSFFERFCGPNPGARNLQHYVTDVLPEYRASLLRRNLSSGLDMCLLGALRHDLYPGLWLESISDDDVWAALDKAKLLHDPYSLLGVLDLAFRRFHDERFRGLVENVVDVLCADTLKDNDGNDVYELMPLFADLTLHQLNMMEEGVKRAPFWKKMCAWMHAGMLARLSRNSGWDPKAMKVWIQGQITTAGAIANILDLRREPMVSAMLMTTASLRGEVLGRLAQILTQYRTAAESLPGLQRLDEVLIKAQPTAMPLMCLSPGPLEGNRRPQKTVPEMLLANKEDLLNKLKVEPLGPVWSWLAQVAQVYQLDEDILATARNAIRDALISDGFSFESLRFFDALLVAISIPDIELRDAIIDRLVS